MDSETMLSLLRHEPFQPLEVRLLNGDRFTVDHPKSVLILKSSLIFGSPQSDDFIFCSLLHIADVKAIPSPAGGPAPRENGQDR